MFCFSCSSSDDGTPDKGGSEGEETPTTVELAKRNTERAIELIDNAVECYFTGNGMAMSRFYNPYNGKKSDELGSVWMYTSSIEAVNAVLHALNALKEEGQNELYDAHFNRYKELLSKLYENGDYYLGTYSLVSYTQTKEWTVYGVNRGRDKGSADVAGIMNVYDDQMWFIREFWKPTRLLTTVNIWKERNILPNMYSTGGTARSMRTATNMAASLGVPAM